MSALAPETEPPLPERKPALGADFRVRLISGVVMAAGAAGILMAGPYPFYALVGVVAVLTAWEWSRLVRGTGFDAAGGLHIACAAGCALLAVLGWPGLGIMLAVIGSILLFLLTVGGRSVLSTVGVLYAALPAISMIWLRSDAALGLTAVLFLILTVVATDVGAFVTGRLVGGPKLWPAVSPNKTWSGLAGAVGTSALAAALFALTVPGASSLRLALVGAVLAVVAQAGDLAESSLKRHFHVKDTSNLIPGHGGVMDRVDGLVAAAMAVGLGTFLVNVYSPARALLLG